MDAISRIHTRSAAAAFALFALLAACSSDNPDDLLRSARDYSAKGDHNAAAIQLKNALQQKPELGEARLLLGKALLETRDPAGAERELRRALEFGQSTEAVLPSLVRALFEQREFEKIIAEGRSRKLSAPDAEARLRATVGDAQFFSGNTGEAADSYAAALSAVPGFAPAQLGQARIAAGGGNAPEALRLVDAAIGTTPAFGEAYVMKAELQHAQGDSAAARKTVEAGLQQDAAYLPLHFLLISMLLEEGTFDAATERIAATRKIAGGDLRVSYFESLLAFRRGDPAKAREHVQQVLKRIPDHVPSLVLSGAIEVQLGQTGAAENNLRRALDRSPTNGSARRLLVATLLRAGQPGRALEALQPLITKGASLEPSLALLAGETYFANGDLQRAGAAFQVAAELQPQTAVAKTRLGQIAMAGGNPELGFRELEAAAAADPRQNQADLALITGYLKRGDSAKALAAAQSLVKKQPDRPVSYQALGIVQLVQKNLVAARASFGKALEIAPTFLPAAYNLAALDLAEKKREVARARFEAMLQREPNNEQILLAMADIEQRGGAKIDELAVLMNKAVAVNPQSANARVALITFHLRNRDAPAALKAAQDAAGALPNDARVIEALAIAQDVAGDQNQALSSIHRLVSLQPTAAEPLLRLAAMHVKRREHDRAIESLQRAQKLAPENRQIDRDLVAVQLLAGKNDAALKSARDLQSRAPKHAGGWVLEADVHMVARRLGDAERAFRAALKLEPRSGVVAAKLYESLQEAGKIKDAASFTTAWLAANPRDTILRMVMADRSLRTKNLKLAAAQYQSVVDIQPNNVVALNNLAWIGGELGDAKAVSYAERALKLAPENASVLDTLGMLLIRGADGKRGLAHLQKARSLAPERPDLHLNYARALVQLGQKDDAKKELETLIAGKHGDAEKQTASALLKSL